MRAKGKRGAYLRFLKIHVDSRQHGQGECSSLSRSWLRLSNHILRSNPSWIVQPKIVEQLKPRGRTDFATREAELVLGFSTASGIPSCTLLSVDSHGCSITPSSQWSTCKRMKATELTDLNLRTIALRRGENSGLVVDQLVLPNDMVDCQKPSAD